MVLFEMKLWLLKVIDWKAVDYDEYNGFVIRAENETHARVIAAAYASDEDSNSDRFLNKEKTTCEEIQVNGEAGVVLSDFNAG